MCVSCSHSSVCNYCRCVKMYLIEEISKIFVATDAEVELLKVVERFCKYYEKR